MFISRVKTELGESCANTKMYTRIKKKNHLTPVHLD